MFAAFDHVIVLLDDMVKRPGLWPIVEIIILAMFLTAAVYIMKWANRDRKAHGSMVEVPNFILSGPLHDAMETIDEIAEEARKATAAVRDVKTDLDAIDRGQHYTHQLLEAVLRNQELAPPSAPVTNGSPVSVTPRHRKPPT